MENIQNSAVEELPEPMPKDNEKIHKKRMSLPQYKADELISKKSHSKHLQNISDGDEAHHSGSDGVQRKTNTLNNLTNSNSTITRYHQLPKKYGANDDFKYPYQKYTKEANYAGVFYDQETGRRLTPGEEEWHERVHERVRRAATNSGPTLRREDNKNTCSLYIQTDPLIWRHIREGIADVSYHFSCLPLPRPALLLITIIAYKMCSNFK